MKKAFAMLLSLALLLGAAGAMAESTTITMGTNAGFAPFEYIGDDGEIEKLFQLGFQISRTDFVHHHAMALLSSR